MKKISSSGPLLALMCAASLVGCKPADPPSAPAQSAAATPAAASDLRPTAGIQDIMAYMIDPAADFLWESVSTTVSESGTNEHQPRTDEEWDQVRKQAIILTEAANLIMMEGRHVAREGAKLEDHGTPGNLTAAESEREIKANRATFVSFAQALHDVGTSMLKAADTKNTQAILDAGDTMDTVCESCHLKFWYPGQNIPQFPNQAPELK